MAATWWSSAQRLRGSPCASTCAPSSRRSDRLLQGGFRNCLLTEHGCPRCYHLQRRLQCERRQEHGDRADPTSNGNGGSGPSVRQLELKCGSFVSAHPISLHLRPALLTACACTRDFLNVLERFKSSTAKLSEPEQSDSGWPKDWLLLAAAAALQNQSRGQGGAGPVTPST